jgi:hypothetical protein
MSKTTISWVIAGLITVGFLFAGVTKLLGIEMQIKNLKSWGFPLWLRFPIGLIELIFAATILIPKYRKLTIYGIFFWTAIAVATLLQASQTSMIGAPIFFSILAGLIFSVCGGAGKSSPLISLPAPDSFDRNS